MAALYRKRGEGMTWEPFIAICNETVASSREKFVRTRLIVSAIRHLHNPFLSQWFSCNFPNALCLNRSLSCGEACACASSIRGIHNPLSRSVRLVQRFSQNPLRHLSLRDISINCSSDESFKHLFSLDLLANRTSRNCFPLSQRFDAGNLELSTGAMSKLKHLSTKLSIAALLALCLFLILFFLSFIFFSFPESTRFSSDSMARRSNVNWTAHRETVEWKRSVSIAKRVSRFWLLSAVWIPWQCCVCVRDTASRDRQRELCNSELFFLFWQMLPLPW